MELETFIKQRKHFFWDIKNPENVSEESVVEHILNYGDFDDIRKMIQILTIEKVAHIFRKQIHQKRNNYDKKIANYFKLYFNKHA